MKVRIAGLKNSLAPVLFTAIVSLFVAVGSFMAGQSDVIADLGLKRSVYYEAKSRCESFEQGPCVVVGARGFMPKSQVRKMKPGLVL